MDDDNLDYDPESLSGCLTDIRELAIAIVCAAAVVVTMWHLIGWAIGLLIP